MRILIATDLWLPLRHGVERMLHKLAAELVRQGDKVEVIGPDRFKLARSSFDPSISLAANAVDSIGPMIDGFAPEALHIATEGTVGFAARGWCLKTRHPFTSSYMTKLPEFAQERSGAEPETLYAKLRQFHVPSARVLVPAESIAAELRAKGFRNLQVWPFGVDTELFHPGRRGASDLERPIHLCVARISAEKNLEAFLDLDLPGSKIMIGDGPLLEEYKRAYPGVLFPGTQEGEALARFYADADVFVFPGRTDTFGLVILEALASGLPVAAYPVPGPKDILAGSGAGALDEDLGRAVKAALAVPRERARAHALTFSWAESARRFRELLTPFPHRP
ncbi:GDP-mannose-dependent alpha-mannosyltransferase [Hypericibacter adhaerens]|uniref:GDP-mannose-dependent alpha-mannosyltransferase n=1 Tax=Hypericibacter adhaerens TaxID=2602016 RepID=A0A5J6MU68_9PROT|nr:glycosyltransferase family 1 protein [Hypericibacter adhaerens]QEX20831.1 GDP-mannose-dependent alpha-mannosyltransferase [Hypericibacter adhaerens]